MKRRIISALILAVATLTSQAQSAPNDKPRARGIHLHCETSDNASVGTAYCSALRDWIETSPRYYETHVADHSIGQYILRVDVMEILPGKFAVAAVVLTGKNHGEPDLYLEQWVAKVWHDRIGENTANIMASVDSEITNMELPPVEKGK